MKYLYMIGIWPLRLYWFIFRPETYGVKGIVQSGNQILFLRHTYGDPAWGLPGGGIKKGESLEDGMRRELHEETNLTVKSLTKLGEIYSTKEYKRDHTTIFHIEVTDASALKVDEIEIEKAVWSMPKDLSDISKGTQEALRFLIHN